MKQKLFSLLTLLLVVCSSAWAKQTSTLPTSGSFSNSTTKYELANSEGIVSNGKIYWASRGSVSVGAYGLRPYRMAYALQVTGVAKLTFNVKSTTTSARTITGQAYIATDPFFNVWKNTTTSPAQTLEAYVIAVNAKDEGDRSEEEAAIHAVTKLAAITSGTDANKKMLICESAESTIATATGSAISHSCPTTNGGTNSFEVVLPAAGKYVIYLESSGSNVGITSIDVEEVTTYTITYDKGANGGGTIADGVKLEGSAFTLSSETFTRDGYVQTGWATTDGGAKVYELGGSYTTEADITLYPVWQKIESTISLFNYEDAKTISQLGAAGWTFNSASFDADPADNEAYVNLVSAMTTAGLTAPGSNGMQSNAIAFAKNTDAYAVVDLGAAKTIAAVSGTFYIGSANDRSFTIQYLDESENELAKFTVNHSKVNWGANNVNKVKVVDDVRFIRINAVAEKSWLVMNNLSISTLYSEYYCVSTLSGRNYGTMVTPAGKKLNFAAVADDAKAYIVTGLNGAKNKVMIQSIDVIPANTPILLYTTTQGATVNVPVTDADASDVSKSVLVAGDGTTTWDGTPGYSYLYISNDSFKKATSGTLKSGKAYAKIASGDLAGHDLSFGFEEGESEGEVTAIAEMKTIKNVESKTFYDLSGRRVTQPTKGLYIMDGKKVVLK